MGTSLNGINALAVVTAAISGMLLGAAWYSPLLFGNAWLRALGKTQQGLASPAPAMIGSLLASALTAIVLAVIVSSFGATSWAQGMAIGGLCGLGLVAPAMLSDSLFCGWGWPLYWIQVGYRVSYCLIMGAILGAWPAI